MLMSQKRYGADATINYRKGKIDATVAGNYLQNDIAGRREGCKYND
jgi:hypothetical protein